MAETPWQGDASSLVDEFRARRRSPLEELQATMEREPWTVWKLYPRALKVNINA